MATIHEGQNKIGNFSLRIEGGKARIDAEIFEEWVDIDESTTARCGTQGVSTITRSIGLSQKATRILTTNIESSIGAANLASLKSKVEETMGFEINWSDTRTSTKTFTFTAPKYGRHTITIYQLIRIYKFKYFRKNWFSWGEEVWHLKWKHSLIEDTNKHDMYVDFVLEDEACNPPKKTEQLQGFDGELSLDFGHISFRAPYSLTEHGFDMHIIDKVVSITFSDRSAISRGLDSGLHATIPISLIPEPLLFLGNVVESELEAEIKKCRNIYQKNISTPSVDESADQKPPLFVTVMTVQDQASDSDIAHDGEKTT